MINLVQVIYPLDLAPSSRTTPITFVLPSNADGHIVLIWKPLVRACIEG
jgi:hypothetical protein